MKQPFVGVVPLYDEAKESYWMLPGYMNAVEAAGGVPAMLPLTSDERVLAAVADAYDGFLFTGGHDVDPAMYGEEKLDACGEPCPARDAMERTLFRLVTERNKPAFGICRGLQLFNVLLGGTLVQDLPTQRVGGGEPRIEHKQRPPYSQPTHRVRIEPGTPLFDIVGEDELQVNSYHHQGIKRLSGRLVAAAAADDGLIEAVWMPEKPFVLAVQWHPEFAYASDEASFRLFRRFVEACRG